MNTERLDIRGVLDKSARRMSIGELQKRGIASVRLLDERMVERLIRQAVERIIGQRVQSLTEAERDRIYREARLELDALIRERAETAGKDREDLVRENERLKREIELIRRVSEEEARRREEQHAAVLRQMEAQRDAILGALERVTRKVEAIRMKVSPGDGTYVPGAVALGEILAREVKSNLESVGIAPRRASSTSGGVAQALERLRAVRRASSGS
jgi:hypothetical protein